MSGWLWFLLLLNLYFLLVFVLVRTGWLGRLNMSLFGPALMLKTERGRGILDFFARARRFFDVTAAVGLRVTYVVMALMSLLLILQLWLIFQIPPEAAPSPRLILGIPGINPLIPIGYGILALVVAVVVHEFGHGILARVHGLRVKTMGLLFFIIPVGAFVEPDEEELKAAPRRARQKVFAAGPTMNLLFAILFALLFSPVLMGSAAAVDGAPILAVEADGPAGQADGPGDAVGLQPGWIIVSIDGRPVHDRDDFVTIVNSTAPGAHILVSVVEAPGSARMDYGIVPRRCIQQYGESECLSTGRRVGHPDPLNRTVIGVSIYATEQVRGLLANPFSSFGRPGELASWQGVLYYISVPFEALQGQFPLAGAFQGFYETPFHAPTFWFLANSSYWLFWINLMLALTNALPILPLDGGYMFRDWVDGIFQRRAPAMPTERRTALVRRLSLFVAFFLLGLVLLQFIGPRLAGLL